MSFFCFVFWQLLGARLLVCVLQAEMVNRRGMRRRAAEGQSSWSVRPVASTPKSASGSVSCSVQLGTNIWIVARVRNKHYNIFFFFKSVTDFIIDTCLALQGMSKPKTPIDLNMTIPPFFFLPHLCLDKDFWLIKYMDICWYAHLHKGTRWSFWPLAELWSNVLMRRCKSCCTRTFDSKHVFHFFFFLWGSKCFQHVCLASRPCCYL